MQNTESHNIEAYIDRTLCEIHLILQQQTAIVYNWLQVACVCVCVQM